METARLGHVCRGSREAGSIGDRFGPESPFGHRRDVFTRQGRERGPTWRRTCADRDDGMRRRLTSRSPPG